MKTIKKTELHPEGNNDVTLYPKTSVDQIDGIGTVIYAQPFFYNGLLVNGEGFNMNLLIPQTDSVEEGVKVIDKSGQLFQFALSNGGYVVNQLTVASEYNAEINQKLTDLDNKIDTESQDLEAKIAEVDADSISRNSATLTSANTYADAQDQKILQQAKTYIHVLHMQGDAPSYNSCIIYNNSPADLTFENFKDAVNLMSAQFGGLPIIFINSISSDVGIPTASDNRGITITYRNIPSQIVTHITYQDLLIL